MRDSLSFSLRPKSQLEKKNLANLWWNYDETYDEAYDVIALNTASKCLAGMKGCWDPEFEPSVEEIVDYRWDMAILSVCFVWWGRTRGDFPIQSSTWQWRSHPGQPTQAGQSAQTWLRRCWYLGLCMHYIDDLLLYIIVRDRVQGLYAF